MDADTHRLEELVQQGESNRQTAFAPIKQDQMVLNYIDNHSSIKRAELMELSHTIHDQTHKHLLRFKSLFSWLIGKEPFINVSVNIYIRGKYMRSFYARRIRA